LIELTIQLVVLKQLDSRVVNESQKYSTATDVRSHTHAIELNVFQRLCYLFICFGRTSAFHLAVADPSELDKSVK